MAGVAKEPALHALWPRRYGEWLVERLFAIALVDFIFLGSLSVMNLTMHMRSGISLAALLCGLSPTARAQTDLSSTDRQMLTAVVRAAATVTLEKGGVCLDRRIGDSFPPFAPLGEHDSEWLRNLVRDSVISVVSDAGLPGCLRNSLFIYLTVPYAVEGDSVAITILEAPASTAPNGVLTFVLTRTALISRDRPDVVAEWKR